MKYKKYDIYIVVARSRFLYRKEGHGDLPQKQGFIYIYQHIYDP